MQSSFTPAERRLIALWERHMRCEFVDHDPVATVETMTADSYVNHVPVMAGGRDRGEALRFYADHFLSKLPADMETALVCRTVGQGRVVDELIVRFTHDIEMDWMLPGVAPTGRKVEVPFVVVVQCTGEKISCERIYWDQASALVQIGLLDAADLPAAGVDTARKVVDPSQPSNELIRRVQRRRGDEDNGC